MLPNLQAEVVIYRGSDPAHTEVLSLVDVANGIQFQSTV